MDSVEHGESSSSPSANVDVQKKKRSRPGAELRVFFSDGTEADVAMRVWEERPFHAGDALSEEQVAHILSASQLIQAREQALSLLARKEETRFLLRRKLLQRSYAEHAIIAALDYLQDRGLLDDARFAREWLRSRLRRRPEGERVLIARLRERGVSNDVANQALNHVLEQDPDSIIRAALRLLERADPTGAQDRDDLRYQLRAAGFSSGVIGEAMERRKTT